MPQTSVTVIGAGLAGSEAAYQLAVRGVDVTLFEMRPARTGPAHHTGDFAELVCSNSLKADRSDRPSAAVMLKREAETLGSLILACARATAVPAGTALAVDRARFSSLVTRVVTSHPNVKVIREEAACIPEGDVIVATGPLTSPALEGALSALVGSERLAFFDAAAPIVDATTVNRGICFAASRYEKGEGADYLNCPMDRACYEAFIDGLLEARRVEPREFETRELFQACQPIEEVARVGRDAPRHGALKPVGLTDPASGRRPWAVLQLRPEDRERSSYNLVGCQTNLPFAEQRRVFRLVPGLERAEFLRYGVMHRNTFVDAPRLLRPDLALRDTPRVRIAGQLGGSEGYMEAAMSGLVAALGTWAAGSGGAAVELPRESAFGALLAYATGTGTGAYQPMHVNFGLLPPLDPPVKARDARHAAIVERGMAAVDAFVRRRVDLGIAAAAASVARDVSGSKGVSA